MKNKIQAVASILKVAQDHVAEMRANTYGKDRSRRILDDLGVGLAVQVSRNGSAFINYDSILGLNHTTYNSFTTGIRMTF